MRSKDTLVLEKLYSKIVTEKFYSYDPPQDKKTLMYDFYVINYLQFLLNLPSQGFRDLPDDISESIKNAAQKLYPYLKKELLDAVFFSICAEFRHFSDYDENYKRIENMYGDNENITKFFNLYDRYRKFYKKGSKEQDELVKIFGVEKPSAKNRPPEIEKKEGHAERVTSYKAVNYALEQTGMSRSFFVSLARDCYIKLIWSSSYGGDAWCGICKGWLLLDAAEKMESTASVSTKAPEAEVKGRGEEPDFYKQKAERTKKAEAPAETKQLDVPAAIDHIYDLQHNTDTVFNKLRSYYKGGYGWIEQALTDKANVKSYYELLKKTSGTVRALAPRILYNKLGETWESATKNKTPDSNSGIPKIKSKETKCGDIPKYQEIRKSEPDQGNFPVTPVGSYETPKDTNDEYKWTNADILSLVDYAKNSGANSYSFNKDEKDYVSVKAVLGGGKLSDGSILPKDKINFEIIDNTSNDENYMQKTFDADEVKNNTVTVRVWLNMGLALLYSKISNDPKSDKGSSTFPSSNFWDKLFEIEEYEILPLNNDPSIKSKYGISKNTIVQKSGPIPLPPGTSFQVFKLKGEGETFNIKIGEPFNIFHGKGPMKSITKGKKEELISHIGKVILNHNKDAKNKMDDATLQSVIGSLGSLNKDSSTFTSWNFDKQALNAVFLMPEDDVYNIGKNYYVGKSTTDDSIAFVVGYHDDSFSKDNQIGDPFQVSKNAFVKLSATQQSVIDFVNKTISDHKEVNLYKEGDYITPEGVTYLLNDLIEGATHTLKDGYSLKWKLTPTDYVQIFITGPEGPVKDFVANPKNIPKIYKSINDFIKVDVAKGTLIKKGLISPSSSASGILNQGVYVTGSDIDSLLKKSPNESMELKDGFHVSYWKSTAVPSQKGMLQFRVFKKLEDGDFKLIHNMTDMKKGNNAVATEINNAIKEYIKENPTSKPYDPTKAPSYMPSVGFSPTGYKPKEEPEEESEYSFDEEEDIEDDYINVKALKFTFYSGGVVLGDGYTASVGPKIEGSTQTPDPFKMLEIKKGKKVIFSDRLYQSDIEDKFQKLKDMAETINKKIKKDLGGKYDIDSEHSMSDMDSDPPTNESFKGFFFRIV